jgi:hypothetical protein
VLQGAGASALAATDARMQNGQMHAESLRPKLRHHPVPSADSHCVSLSQIELIE